MTEHFVFWLKQTKDPAELFGQIRTRTLTGDGGEKFTTILIDEIRSEEKIDEKIDMLIRELKIIGKEAKRKVKKQISMSKK